MCGILAVIDAREPDEIRRLARKMSHRGPDERGFVVTQSGIALAHERLAIMDLENGRQPIQGTRNSYVIHNGEIYNHEDLHKRFLSERTFRSRCDSEVIVHLFEEFGDDFVHLLDGIFALAVTDGEKFLVARDPIGVKPLYYGKDAQGAMYFASEMKVIEEQCVELACFPPGHYYTPAKGFVKYFKPDWEDARKATSQLDYDAIRKGLEAAVEKRLMSDVPIGAFLSGGLDSSLVASIAARKLQEKGEKLRTFSIGISKESPDLIAARKVADFIGSEHHEIIFSKEQGIALLEKLCWHLESYDVTTLRASTPMYILSQYISSLGIKVVLSGEGADEMFGGYLYFHNAPSSMEFQAETVRRVKRLYTADLLRSDKSTMAHGLEARVPFLDLAFLQTVLGTMPEYKQPDRSTEKCEKYILRKAFDDYEKPYLPDEILWRQKEQFSDGVGYSWVDALMEHTSAKVSEAEMSGAALVFPHNTPHSKEAYYYRRLFVRHFSGTPAAHTVMKWIPTWQENKDPSGRASSHHDEGDMAQKVKVHKRV